MNPIKVVCSVRYSKFKHFPKMEIKLSQNSLVISHLLKRWSIISSVYLENEHRGEQRI